ncbi:MAG: glycoside hydrolase family 13 protein [Vulcanimicrobiota bacterium]
MNKSDKNVKTPEWARDVIWYQIFPERFRNGDPTNDPTLEDIREKIPGWVVREWGSDWYKPDSWEEENFPSIFKSIYQRRYGGDLQGIIDKLDYLENLGITGIYLNPVFRAPSLHKYDGMCFHHIEETFGPDPEGDRKMIAQARETHDPDTWVWTSADKLFFDFLEKAHRRGIKVIIDGVFNHSSRYFFAFQDILEKGRKSIYTDWYEIKKWDDSLPDGFEYTSWHGYHYLPEFRKVDDNLNPGYKKYLFDITRRWMAPHGNVEEGIDGWRLDVAFCIPHGFWKEWRKVVKGINPLAYLVAEVIEIKPEYLQGDEFDALMNYPFAINLISYFVNKKNKISTTEFVKRMEDLRKAYPDEITRVMQNLLSSHDTPRLRTFIVNPDMNLEEWSLHHSRSQAEHNLEYRLDRGAEIHKKIHKMMAAFQLTYMGAPMIYYGDELGMSGANDPDCRKPMLWEDLKYEDEICYPHKDKPKVKEQNAPDLELKEYYKKLIQIRKKHISLRRGSFKVLLSDDERDILAFQREYKQEKIITVFNNNKETQNISLFVEIPEGETFTDLLEKAREYEVKKGKLNLVIPGKNIIILQQNR